MKIIVYIIGTIYKYTYIAYCVLPYLYICQRPIKWDLSEIW